MTPKNFRDKLDQQREAAAHHAAKTPAQILDLLREDETRNPKSHAEKTVVITDRGGGSTTMAYGFFKDEAYKRPDDNGWSYDDQIEKNEIHIWRSHDDPQDAPAGETIEEPAEEPEKEANGFESPKDAAARFWREASEGATKEFEPAEVEQWLSHITDAKTRNQTRAAILERAEPTNMPITTPRFTEEDLRDILGDKETELAAAEQRIRKIQDSLREEEEAHEKTREDAEAGEFMNREEGCTWAEALEEAQSKFEENAKNPETGNTWEDDYHEEKEEREQAQEELEEIKEELKEARSEEAAHEKTKADLESAEKAAKFWEDQHEKNRARIDRILKAHFERDEDALRKAAGEGPIILAKIATQTRLDPNEAATILNTIGNVMDIADDGTPNGRDAWAGATADDDDDNDETGWRMDAARKTNIEK